MKTLIIGDLHANFGLLNLLLKKEEPELVLSTGDFGYWPDFLGEWHTDPITGKQKIFQMYLENKCPIYFCDGNHEDHTALLNLKSNEIMPNIFYMKRGSTLTINNINILFIGGAFSIDRTYRIPQKTWFIEETIQQKDILNLPDMKIDMIISHTAPREFVVINDKDEFAKDPSRDALSYVLNKYNPELWNFSHWHKYMNGKYHRTHWTCLDMAGVGKNWYKVLDIC